MAVAADALPVEPSVERVRALAADYNLIPLRHSFIDDTETPVSAFLKLRAAASEQPAFLLESAERGQQFGRYSFIGVQPRSVVRWSLGDEPADPYALAAAEVGRYTQAPLDDLPPFAGGAAGSGQVEVTAERRPWRRRVQQHRHERRNRRSAGQRRT